MTKELLVSAAISGLIAFSANSALADGNKKKADHAKKDAKHKEAKDMKHDKATGDIHCMGINGCKGKSACAVKGSHGCGGQNGCKGKGYVSMSKKACHDKGGKEI